MFFIIIIIKNKLAHRLGDVRLSSYTTWTNYGLSNVANSFLIFLKSRPFLGTYATYSTCFQVFPGLPFSSILLSCHSCPSLSLSIGQFSKQFWSILKVISLTGAMKKVIRPALWCLINLITLCSFKRGWDVLLLPAISLFEMRLVLKVRSKQGGFMSPFDPFCYSFSFLRNLFCLIVTC